MKTTWKYGTGSRSAMRASTHCSASRSLALRTVAIAAGIIRDAGYATVVAGIDVTAEPGCPAGFDSTHDTSFAAAKMTGVLSSVGRPMPPKDVGDFEGQGATDYDSGGVTSSRNRSSGLVVEQMVLVETCV